MEQITCEITSVNYYKHIPLLDHLILARCYHIRKNFEFLEREFSAVAEDLAMIVNYGTLKGLCLDGRITDI